MSNEITTERRKSSRKRKSDEGLSDDNGDAAYDEPVDNSHFESVNFELTKSDKNNEPEQPDEPEPPAMDKTKKKKKTLWTRQRKRRKNAHRCVSRVITRHTKSRHVRRSHTLLSHYKIISEMNFHSITFTY